jgi:hypothetical protein
MYIVAAVGVNWPAAFAMTGFWIAGPELARLNVPTVAVPVGAAYFVVYDPLAEAYVGKSHTKRVHGGVAVYADIAPLPALQATRTSNVAAPLPPVNSTATPGPAKA